MGSSLIQPFFGSGFSSNLLELLAQGFVSFPKFGISMVARTLGFQRAKVWVHSLEGHEPVSIFSSKLFPSVNRLSERVEPYSELAI
jgi:hypothetical protein